jgi:hypothetical protein
MEHVKVSEAGVALMFDATRSVVVTDAVALSVPLATTVPVWESVKVMLGVPLVKPVQGAATELTVNVRVGLPRVSVPLVGAMVSPVGSTGVTVIVCELVRVFLGVTAKVRAVPGPVAVLHVTAPDRVPAVMSEFVACMVPAHTVIANRLPSARTVRFLNIVKSMEDLPFPGGFLHDNAGRRPAFWSLPTYRS